MKDFWTAVDLFLQSISSFSWRNLESPFFLSVGLCITPALSWPLYILIKCLLGDQGSPATFFCGVWTALHCSENAQAALSSLIHLFSGMLPVVEVHVLQLTQTCFFSCNCFYQCECKKPSPMPPSLHVNWSLWCWGPVSGGLLVWKAKAGAENWFKEISICLQISLVSVLPSWQPEFGLKYPLHRLLVFNLIGQKEHSIIGNYFYCW